MSFSNSLDPVYKTNVNDLLKNQSDLFLKFNSHSSSSYTPHWRGRLSVNNNVHFNLFVTQSCRMFTKDLVFGALVVYITIMLPFSKLKKLHSPSIISHCVPLMKESHTGFEQPERE